MNKIQLYRLLRKNTRLSYRRSPVFEQGMVAKVLMFLGGGMFALYLLIYGLIIGMSAKGDPYWMFKFMPFALIIDFGLRFIVQTTPAMQVKPYILMPVSRYTAIECFLLSSHVSVYNLLWLCMFVPYAIIAVCGGAPFLTTMVTVVACELLMVLNSQIYLFFRTLINRNVLWVLAGLAFYALMWLPWMLKMSEKGFEQNLDMFSTVGAHWSFMPVAILLLVGIFFVNRRLQFLFVYEEITKKGDKALKKVSSFSFLNRFGEVGEYLKIELKSNMRNKTMKSRCIMSISLIVVFCALIAYTPIYDGRMISNFWCLYCFAIYGATTLVKIMGPEGNYIDLLMVHRENIIPLLKAKYYFHSAILIIPFLIMLPAVFEGKFTLLMLFAYAFNTSGFIYFLLFQLAVQNKQTLPLNQKVTGKGNFENGIQIMIEMLAFFLPIVMVSIGFITIGETTTYIVMMTIGIFLTVTNGWWIRNIYHRMMKNKYANLEGFHTTRE